MEYPVESFSADERTRLRPHVTNLDAPVFALVNLPETVKGALFARYSRYPGTLRRLALDEFAETLGDGDGDGPTYDNAEGARAADFYERIFVGYGDDSIAQLGGAHVACEWVSNVLTKVLQRPRLGAYLEQSTRYIAYDAPIEGSSCYRYYRDAELGREYEAAMDEIFDVYAAAIPRVCSWAAERYPAADGESPRAHARAIKAKALDLLRGLLPAASLSHMGIFATGQTYEQLVMHLLAHPLPEARHYGSMILSSVQAVMPSFVSRVERPDRGGEWIAYLRRREQAGERWAARLGLDRAPGDDGAGGPSVRLTHHDGDEVLMLAALLFEATGVDEQTTLAALAGLDGHERAELVRDLTGDRANRRHRPGRGLESLRYRFEIVSDYGAFRDLQRHRMLTCQWQALTPDLGAGVPEEVDEAGVGDDFRRALHVSQRAYERLLGAGHDRRAAMYALCLGYRLRYVLDLNARAAMQLIELRSGREGHPAYRAVAQAMHERIASVHPAVAAAMTHVDRETEPRLERIVSELRTQAKLDARAASSA
ncbi:MAG TPA: FAD-dependent thymidylate synthase [Solirubrobacteraceae bacterium]